MKIIISMPGDFLRTKNRTNPFIDPIVRVCEKNNIDYRILIPTFRPHTGYNRQKVVGAWTFCWGGIAFWKVIHFFTGLSPEEISKIWGRIWNIITLGYYKADLYITVAGMFSVEFRGAFPKARFAGLQHGVIYSKHPGYFDKDGRAKLIGEMWVYGKGYADCFFKHPDNAKDLEGRIKVIGDVVRAGAQVEGCRLKVEGGELNVEDEGERDLVVMSLQLTDDLDKEEKAGSVKVMEEFFGEFFKKYEDKYTVLFKHHPRFNDCYDLSDFYKKFPQIKESKEPWNELYPKMAMHITFTSTTTFDCASQGIPTLLLDLPSAKIINRWFYRDDYAYPYFNAKVEDVLLGGDEVRRNVFAWYQKFYATFNEENCLKLITE